MGSPCWKTTMLCRTSADSILSMETASLVRGPSSASAALPSYRRNWLHAFRLSAIDESGCACHESVQPWRADPG